MAVSKRGNWRGGWAPRGARGGVRRETPRALDRAIEIDDIALVLARAIEAVTEGVVEIDATSPTVDATTGTAGTIDTLAETTIDAIATTAIAIDIKKQVSCCKSNTATLLG